MPRHLLQIAGSPENILSMTQDELAFALLEDMLSQAVTSSVAASLIRRPQA